MFLLSKSFYLTLWLVLLLLCAKCCSPWPHEEQKQQKQHEQALPLPLTFRGKRFTSKGKNLLQETQKELREVWHCASCVDTNPFNPFLAEGEIEDEVVVDEQQDIDGTIPNVDENNNESGSIDSNDLTHEDVAIVDYLNAADIPEEAIHSEENISSVSICVELKPETDAGDANKSQIIQVSSSFEPLQVEEINYNSQTLYIVAGSLVIVILAALSIIQFIRTYPNRFINRLSKRLTMLQQEGNHKDIVRELSSLLCRVEYYRGQNHPETCSFKHQLAQSCIEINHASQAVKLLTELQETYSASRRNKAVCLALEDLGMAYNLLGEDSAALKSLYKALVKLNEEHYIAQMVAFSGNSNSEVAQCSGTNSVSVNDIDSTPTQRYEDLCQTSDISPDHTFDAGHNESIAQNLDDAFIAEDDFNLERILQSYEQEEEEIIEQTDDVPQLLFDIFEAPNKDSIRLCKKIGHIYDKLKNYQYAMLFFGNALEVAQKLNESTSEVEMLRALMIQARTKYQLKPSNTSREISLSPNSVTQFVSIGDYHDEILLPLKPRAKVLR